MLTITSTSRPATDLGFLLHKHPDRLHTVDLAFGRAHVFRLTALERVLSEFAWPVTVVVTTPNVEYNVRFGPICDVDPEGGAPTQMAF